LNQSTNDLVTTNRGNLFVPQTPEAFSYDADGNLTQDGRWQYTWDGENRLTQVQSLSGNPTASKRRVTYEYDWHGRRTRRQEFDGSSGTYVLTNDQRMVYDGWQCIGDLTTNLVLQRAYVWGLDVSGTMGGAGGVGGLLWFRSSSNGTHYASYDGNGNVTALATATSTSRSGLYEYGPFGQTLRLEGVAADENPWRFSTKRADVTADLLLYEYRALDLGNGKWLNRDPIEEFGGIPLYACILNNPINYIDSDGMQLFPPVLINSGPYAARPTLEEFMRPVVKPNPVLRPIVFDPVPPPFFAPPAQDPVCGQRPVPVSPISAPNPDSEPSLDKFPDIPESADKAPAKCPRTCTVERLRELTKRVNDTCHGSNGLPSCKDEGFFGGGDSYQVLRDKMSAIGQCLNARIRRERECFSGGDKGHVQQIIDKIKQLKDCNRIYNDKRARDFTAAGGA